MIRCSTATGSSVGARISTLERGLDVIRGSRGKTGRKSHEGVPSASYFADVDVIRGAKILRDRFDENGVSPDTEPLQQITEHALPLYAWTGTAPEPLGQVAADENRPRWRLLNR
jgi:hypothetical protein